MTGRDTGPAVPGNVTSRDLGGEREGGKSPPRPPEHIQHTRHRSQGAKRESYKISILSGRWSPESRRRPRARPLNLGVCGLSFVTRVHSPLNRPAAAAPTPGRGRLCRTTENVVDGCWRRESAPHVRARVTKSDAQYVSVPSRKPYIEILDHTKE